MEEAVAALGADHDFLLEAGVFTHDVIDPYIAFKEQVSRNAKGIGGPEPGRPLASRALRDPQDARNHTQGAPPQPVDIPPDERPLERRLAEAMKDPCQTSRAHAQAETFVQRHTGKLVT